MDELDSKNRWLDFVVPNQLPIKREFSRGVMTAIALPLFVLAALCCPPACDFILSRTFDPSLVRNKETILPWTEFVRIFAEVCAALFIGGQVFNDGMRRGVVSIFDNLQDAIDESFKQRSSNVREKIGHLATVIKDALTAKVTLGNIVPNLLVILFSTRRIQDLLITDIPHLQGKLLLIRLYYVFPGGLYGIGAYGCFVVILFMKCFKYYIDRAVLV